MLGTGTLVSTSSRVHAFLPSFLPSFQTIAVPIGRGWPRLEAALRLIWPRRGVLEGELAEAIGVG